MYKDITRIRLLDEIITVHPGVITLKWSVICSQQSNCCALNVEWNWLSAGWQEVFVVFRCYAAFREKSAPCLSIMFCKVFLFRDHRFKIEDLFLSGTNTQSWSLFSFFLGHRFLYRVFYFSRPEKQFWIKKSCLLSREANLGIGPMQISCYSGLLKTRIVFHSSALCQSLHNFCAQNCKFLTAYIRSPMRQMSYFINQCLHHWLCDDRIWDWSRLDSHLMS